MYGYMWVRGSRMAVLLVGREIHVVKKMCSVEMTSVEGHQYGYMWVRWCERTVTISYLIE